MEQAWTVPDVHLLTDGGEGQIAVPHLTLTFAPTGMELDKADGEEVWSSTWTQLQELSPVERSVLPDGRDGVVILVVEREDRRRHRFVLPTDDVASTEATIRRRAVAHGLRTRSPRPAVSRALTASIVLAAAAVMAALLLSAAHVIRL